MKKTRADLVVALATGLLLLDLQQETGLPLRDDVLVWGALGLSLGVLFVRVGSSEVDIAPILGRQIFENVDRFT